MGDLETAIDGSPASIRSVSTWLRKDFGAASDDLATSVFRQRSRAASDWQGEAGTAFQTRAGALADAGDVLRGTTGSIAGRLDTLAQALQQAQADMETVRSDARAGGLTVSGTVVHDPGPAPPEAGTLAADATPAESQRWHDADRKVREHNAKVEAWNHANERAQAVFKAWAQALTDSASAWQEYDDKLVGVSADFLTSAAEIALIAKTVPILVRQSEEYLTQAAQLRAHANALVSPDGTVVDQQRFYQLLDEADDLEHMRAPAAYGDAVRFELPKGVGRALGILGVAATGYGIYDDIQSGESPAQATVSNVAAFGTSIAAGAYIGGVVGTAIPVPVLGTVTGVVVGAAVGTVVGAFTSGVIDGAWENGLDSLGDAGDAVMDGVDEVADTGKAIGGLAEDAWNAIF
jgi:hypothetical protein